MPVPFFCLITQIYSDATGLLDAWQYFKETGDIRLLAVRYYCAGVHFILTLTQLRIIMNGRACFTAGTPLLTQRGWVPIEEITTDDYVWSRPEHDPSAPCEWKRVEELFTRFAQVQNLHVGGQVIGTTSEHPFWVVGQGWKKACELQKGDFLIGHDGRETPVEEIFDTQVFQPVYNLRVQDFHTYFVGSEEWGFSVWAHNLCTEIVTERGQTTLKIKNKFAPGSPESRQLQRFATAWNEEIAKAGGSMTRRILTQTEIGESSAWTKMQRQKFPERFADRVVGHVPDAAAGGAAVPDRAMALLPSVNAYLGGLLKGIPVGTTYNSVQLTR